MRVGALQERLREAGVAAGLVTHPVQVGYLTGAFLDPHERFLALLVPARGKPVVFGPALEAGTLSALGIPFVPVPDGQDIGTVVRGRFPTGGSLALEREHISLAWATQVAQAAGIPLSELSDLGPILMALRVAKDGQEAASLREAARRLDLATAHARECIRPGVTEREMAREIERYMVEDVAAEPGFPGIVLFGERSALPHGVPTGRKLRRGEIVLVDIGLRHGGYNADTTRTFFLGDPEPELRRIYAIVLEAARRGREAVSPGAPMGAPDAAAREFIAAEGYGERFTHRVGHGLGLEVHEEPFLLPGRRDPLRPGMCLTIEPGIYLPGRGGVRIEDDLLVTSDGAELLTEYPRDLEVLSP